jgi:hypothetical protein
MRGMAEEEYDPPLTDAEKAFLQDDVLVAALARANASPESRRDPRPRRWDRGR